MYLELAQLAQDGDFRNRIAACAATLGIFSPHPTAWADVHMWEVAAAPGFAAAYASALAAQVPRPGGDPAVITDEQLLAAVQAALVVNEPSVSEPSVSEPSVSEPIPEPDVTEPDGASPNGID